MIVRLPRQLSVMRRPQGSVLPEPSPEQVYEGRLDPVVAYWSGASEAPMRQPLVVDETSVQVWGPWCPECRLEPIVIGPLGQAEYLARVHDATHHGAAWTARAVLAEQIVELLAAGSAGGVR